MNFMVNESAQKLRGGYYTPPDLADYIARWVMANGAQSVLEPSCGDGVFLDALSALDDVDLRELTAFELEEKEAEKCREKTAAMKGVRSSIQAKDFLQWAITHLSSPKSAPHFDAVVGNPPFIRYQYLPADFQQRAEQMFRLLGLPFTKHTNAWVPFVLACISLLKPGGRLGMVLPTEIIHVAHAQALRTFLGQQCSRLLIVDPEDLWFDGTLQGAVILFAEKKRTRLDHDDGLGIVSVSGRSFLQRDPGAVFDRVPRINGKTVEGKWTPALLTQGERDLLDELKAHRQVHRFDSVADVDVGMVTGANHFFLVDDATLKTNKLAKYAEPMFGRSEHCPGVIYDAEQHASNAVAGYPTHFLRLDEAAAKSSASVRAYIQQGEDQDLHTRYKCRIRKPWYAVPSVYTTSVGMLKRAHDAPRLISNRLGAYCTDTAYRISTHGVEAEKLVFCFINPLTALSAELNGRYYGGGVLELVPSEIERLLLPLPHSVSLDLRALDDSVRTGKMASVLAKQSKIVLGTIGLSVENQDAVLSAWDRLRRRRQRDHDGDDQSITMR